MSDDFVKITLPPVPEGATGQRLYRVGSRVVFPWWLPQWLRRRLPGFLWVRAQRFGVARRTYYELTWKDFIESRDPVHYRVSHALDYSCDESPKWER